MDFVVPEIGEGVYEAELLRWLVEVGDQVKRGQALMEIMTDKATTEVPAPFVGTITSLNAEPGQQIKVGQLVLTYSGTGAAASTPPARRHSGTATANNADANQHASVAVAAPVRTATAPASVKAAPSVRFMARKLGLDLTQVRGSGPDGRVLLGDLTGFVQTAADKPKPEEPKPDYGKPGSRIKLQGLRRKIAEHMVQSKRTVPHYSYVDECDVTDLVRLRASLRDTFTEAGVKLTYLAFFVKAVTAALKEVPLVNAALDEAAGEIVLHDRYHIGIAVAAPAGLIVPVVHDADRKTLAEVAQEIERLSEAARAGKSKLEDLRGSTFTVTSIGNVGGLISTPIINLPNVGILGVGKIVKRPVYDDAGQIRPADLVYLSFSFDHRVVDGAVGAAFGNAVVRWLQNPAALLLPEKLL